MNEELKTSAQWQELLSEIIIVYPDGWDRDNFQFSWYEELITEGEYNRRMIYSACNAIPIEDKLELAIKGLKNIATCDPKHYCSEDLIFIANMFLAKIEKGE
jgi:hypothetical protein